MQNQQQIGTTQLRNRNTHIRARVPIYRLDHTLGQPTAMIFNMRSLSALVVAACMISYSSAGIVYRPSSRGELVANPMFARQKQVSNTSSTPKFEYGEPKHDYPGVVATGKTGPTNPEKPKLGTKVNQTSEARLATLNSVDDWCTFGPKDKGEELGDGEGETVAYCTKPRNNARVIPDGTVKTAHFIKTPLYVQLIAFGDFTKINFKPGDSGGELDPHGATGKGNPVGGNVTSNVTGKDVSYQEWMNYISHEMLCFRVCIAGNDQISPAKECEHTLDEMGCPVIMPGNYHQDEVFDECEADAAYPPGVYVSNGKSSTFQQYNTGVWKDDKGKSHGYTNGDKNAPTPTLAMSMPSSSNCKTKSSISNGIKSIIPDQKPADGGSKGGAGGGGGAGGAGGGGGNSDKGGSDSKDSDSKPSSSSGSGKSSGGSSGGRNGAAALVPSSLTAVIAAVALGAVVL